MALWFRMRMADFAQGCAHAPSWTMTCRLKSLFAVNPRAQANARHQNADDTEAGVAQEGNASSNHSSMQTYVCFK
jgi:hypothetical protein